MYLFDWDRETLAANPEVTLDASVFTITPLNFPDDTGISSDNEDTKSDGRRTWLRIIGPTLGVKYKVENTVTTNEEPPQIFSKYFYLLGQ